MAAAVPDRSRSDLALATWAIVVADQQCQLIRGPGHEIAQRRDGAGMGRQDRSQVIATSGRRVTSSREIGRAGIAHHLLVRFLQ